MRLELRTISACLIRQTRGTRPGPLSRRRPHYPSTALPDILARLPPIFLSTVPGAFPSASPGCTAANDANQQYCPTWQNSRDSSQIWGSRVGSVVAGSDPTCPNAGAIACLLLKAVATKAGQSGEGVFSEVTYVQRLNTVGGSAPATSCTIGQVALVPYTADYTFFSQTQVGQ